MKRTMNELLSSSSASLTTPTSSSDSCDGELALTTRQLDSSLMSLLKENLKCKICYELYDADRHRPVILSSCGHTHCHACLTKILKAMSSASASDVVKNKKPSCPCCGKKIDKKVKELTLNWSIMAIIDDTKAMSVRETCDQFKCKYDQYQLVRQESVASYTPPNLDQVRQEVANSAAEACRQVDAHRNELLRQIDELEAELTKLRVSKRIERLNKRLDDDQASIARRLASSSTLSSRDIKKLNERIDYNTDFMSRQTRLLTSLRHLRMVEFKGNTASRELLASKSFLGELCVLATPAQVSSLYEQSLPYSDDAHMLHTSASLHAKYDASLKRSELVTSNSMPLDPSSLDLFAAISNGF